MPYPTFSSGVLCARSQTGDMLPFAYSVEWDADKGFEESDKRLFAMCLKKGLMLDADTICSTFQQGGKRPAVWKEGLELITRDEYEKTAGPLG